MIFFLFFIAIRNKLYINYTKFKLHLNTIKEMKINDFIEHNKKIQSEIDSISKQFYLLKSHPFNSTLSNIFKTMEMQNNLLEEISSLCNLMISYLTKQPISEKTTLTKQKSTRTISSTYTENSSMNDMSEQLNKKIKELYRNNTTRNFEDNNIKRFKKAMSASHIRTNSQCHKSMIENGNNCKSNVYDKYMDTMKNTFKIKPTYFTRELLRKSYLVLDSYNYNNELDNNIK